MHNLGLSVIIKKTMEILLKILFFLLLFGTFIYSFDDVVVINDKKYKLLKEQYNEYGERGLLLNFYTLDEHKLALSFLLSQQFGGCGKRDYEESTYEIEGSNVTVYTKWRGYDIDGYRKMVYEFDKNLTKAKQISCKLYIDARSLDDKNSGVEYLHTKPKDKKQKELLDEYIKSIEKIYKGEFVLAKRYEQLSHEVEKALKKSLVDRWGK